MFDSEEKLEFNSALRKSFFFFNFFDAEQFSVSPNIFICSCDLKRTGENVRISFRLARRQSHVIQCDSMRRK